MNIVKLKWLQFKEVINQRKISTQHVSNDSTYFISAYDGQIKYQTIVNKLTTEAQDFEDNYLSSSNKSPKQETVGQLEKNDKDLKLACGEVVVNAQTGIAEFTLKVPGQYALNHGRFVAWGEAWFKTRTAGDKVSTVIVRDDDRVLATIIRAQVSQAVGGDIGRNPTDQEIQNGLLILTEEIQIPIPQFSSYPIMKPYHDEELPEENQGCYIPLAYTNAEIEPVGGYGFIPAEFYIVVIGKKGGQGPFDDTFYINIDWAKQS